MKLTRKMAAEKNKNYENYLWFFYDESMRDEEDSREVEIWFSVWIIFIFPTGEIMESRNWINSYEILTQKYLIVYGKWRIRKKVSEKEKLIKFIHECFHYDMKQTFFSIRFRLEKFFHHIFLRVRYGKISSTFALFHIHRFSMEKVYFAVCGVLSLGEMPENVENIFISGRVEKWNVWKIIWKSKN